MTVGGPGRQGGRCSRGAGERGRNGQHPRNANGWEPVGGGVHVVPTCGQLRPCGGGRRHVGVGSKRARWTEIEEK
jgi:hypothetical protein